MKLDSGNHALSYGREKMVQEQLINRGIKTKRVIDAFKKVPRHLFIEDGLIYQAYSDHPLPISEGQTISQPYIAALMTEYLKPECDDTILEIGTGSGYQTAILAELSLKVYSVERIGSIASNARKLLDKLGYHNVMIIIGDGTKGFQEKAPYDGIIVTAAAPDIPEPFLQQLKDGGRIIIPVGDEYSQTLVRITKNGRDFNREELNACRFVKLIGEYGWKA